MPVAPDVPGPFCLPELLSGLRGASIATAMRMPEAAVNEDDLLSARQYDVRRSREIATMESKAISGSKQHLANRNLGFRILAADLAHQRASTIWGKPIHVFDLQFTFRPRTLPVPASFLRAPPNKPLQLTRACQLSSRFNEPGPRGS